jgi:hypothetical protein
MGRREQNISIMNIVKVAGTLGISLADLFSPFSDKLAFTTSASKPIQVIGVRNTRLIPVRSNG